jgi:hypothetical protein
MAIEVSPGTLFEDVKTLVGPKRPDAAARAGQGFFRQCLGQSLLISQRARSIASMVMSPAKRYAQPVYQPTAIS